MASGSDRRIAPRYEVNREFASIDDFVSEYVSNVSGGGINFAQRVMDCGDAGHILLSNVAAELLR